MATHGSHAFSKENDNNLIWLENTSRIVILFFFHLFTKLYQGRSYSV